MGLVGEALAFHPVGEQVDAQPVADPIAKAGAIFGP